MMERWLRSIPRRREYERSSLDRRHSEVEYELAHWNTTANAVRPKLCHSLSACDDIHRETHKIIHFSTLSASGGVASLVSSCYRLFVHKKSLTRNGQIVKTRFQEN
jgi:hypothetical protein